MPIHSRKLASIVSGYTPIACFVILFFLAGCAGKPWSGKFKEDQVKTYKDMVAGEIKAEDSCPSTLDAEVTVNWKTAVDTKTFDGYLQLQLPSSLKFVTTNPLGQPVFALVSDGETYSSVNTISQQYISGSLFSLALRNNIPEQLLTGNWGIWFSGRIAAATGEIADVRKDSAGRGLWVMVQNPKNKLKGKEYILVDSAKKRPLLRVLTDGDDDTIAQIKYGAWQNSGKCIQPTSFNVTDLPLGAEINMHLSDIITDKVFSKNNFILRPPPGYYIQLLP